VIKDRRKILKYLLGFVVAVVGGGGTIYLGLFHQDNSTTATDGGVVLKGCQGISIISTDSRDIHIGISLQEYEAGLRRREQEVTQELEQAHEEERRLLETGKAEIERRLADVQASHGPMSKSWSNASPSWKPSAAKSQRPSWMRLAPP